jgi:dolichol-phosphate mannosyltransferase
MNSLFEDTWSALAINDVAALKGPILVIGATGFIGSKLFFSLAQRRDDVYGAAPLVSQNWRFQKLPSQALSKRLVGMDITQREATLETLKKLRPGTVFNLSAYGAYENESDADRIYQVNFFGAVNLIRSLREIGCEAYVHAGTSSEYGLNCESPKEGDALEPNSDYAVAKASTSHLIFYYGKVLGLPLINLRLYSVYGPYESRNRLIPRLVCEGLEGRFPPLASPNISRDFLYVDDCTRAFVRAAVTACRTTPGLSINIGTGTKLTIRDVAHTAQQVFDIAIEPRFGTMSNRKWDLPDWYANVTLAKETMNWRSSIEFEHGLKLTRDCEMAARKELKATKVFY